VTLTSEEVQAQRSWFEEHWRDHVPFNREIGLQIYSWQDGLVRARLPYEARLSAHDGIFHGGVLASALDTVGCGAIVAGHDFNLGNRFTTVTMTVQFQSVAPHQDVEIEGVCTKRGRRINFARARVIALDGETVAEAMLTVSASGQRPRVGTDEQATPRI